MSIRSSLSLFRGIAAALTLVCVGTGTSAQSPYNGTLNGITTVEVFANSAMVITPTRSDRYRLLIHRMDTMEQVKMAINQQIPRGGEGPARAWFAANQDRIKRQIRPAAIAAANAISRANHYKIDRLPAIVVNGRSVVYGMTGVDAALQRYQATRGAGDECVDDRKGPAEVCHVSSTP